MSDEHLDALLWRLKYITEAYDNMVYHAIEEYFKASSWEKKKKWVKILIESLDRMLGELKNIADEVYSAYRDAYE